MSINDSSFMTETTNDGDSTIEQHIIDNPYWILEISQGASRSEIIQAQMKALKKKHHHVTVIAKAQKILLNPEKRIIADFLLPHLPTIYRYRRIDLSLIDQPIETLEPLPKYVDIEPELRETVNNNHWDEHSFLANHSDLQRLKALNQSNSSSALVSINISSTTSTAYLESTQGISSSQSSHITEVLEKSLASYKLNDYGVVIECLEPLQIFLTKSPKKYGFTLMMLAKSYLMMNKPEKTISICRLLVDHPNDKIRTWSNTVLRR